ncbi:hypothetical protein D3C84_406870 [compost metagenome]
MGQAGGAVGRRHAQIDEAVQIFGTTTGQTPTQQLQAADDAGQHVVEVVGDPAGELSDRFHLLRLAQRLFVVPQLCRALFHLLLKGFKGVLQAQFTLAQVDQPIPGFVLSSASTQGRGDQADQGGRMKRALQKGDVAQLRAKA